MRKVIIAVLMLIVFSASVLAWGANRVITNTGTVVITVDPSDAGQVYFTVQETLFSGVSIDGNLPSGCGLSGKILTCDFENSVSGTITYAVKGTGTISGIIVGGYPSTTKPIIGDSIFCFNSCQTQGTRGCAGNKLQQCIANGPSCNTWDTILDCGTGVCTVNGNSASCLDPTTCGANTCTNYQYCEGNTNCIDYICGGTVPQNAQLCSNDDEQLTTKGTNNALVVACTEGTKCEYFCNSGYTLTDSACVETPSGDLIVTAKDQETKTLLEKINTELRNLSSGASSMAKLAAIAKAIKIQLFG